MQTGAFFVCQDRLGVMVMTDVHCSKRRCLNNRNGWCKAKAICIDGMCRTFADSRTLVKHRCAKVRREYGKYVADDRKVFK